MPVIKRYPNRKLYDTAAKQYVSLEGVADMIRRGESVQVIDHTSGEDHTTLILTQIIVEQEKRGGFLPLDVLTGLVQAGGNTLASLRQRLNAPLDLLRQVDDEIQARIEKLVNLGELAEDEGRRLGQKLLGLGSAMRADHGQQDEVLERVLRSRGVPTRSDIEKLSQVIDQLTAEVESLRREP